MRKRAVTVVVAVLVAAAVILAAGAPASAATGGVDMAGTTSVRSVEAVVAAFESPASRPGIDNTHADRAAAQYLYCEYVITGDGVRLRTQPNTSSTVIGLLYRGDRVGGNFEDTVNYFYYVYSPRHGAWGWVSAQYLQTVWCDW